MLIFLHRIHFNIFSHFNHKYSRKIYLIFATIFINSFLDNCFLSLSIAVIIIDESLVLVRCRADVLLCTQLRVLQHTGFGIDQQLSAVSRQVSHIPKRCGRCEGCWRDLSGNGCEGPWKRGLEVIVEVRGGDWRGDT